MPDPKEKLTKDAFDRSTFFKEVREDCLVKLGLPKNTRPDRVLQLLELQGKLDKIKKDKSSH
ncbi:MAG: hypothetical protein LBF22_03305 [Deltaproteobacteria bacterium]|jgi:hypothetical protein|nr:hypothetical protein [Deltaproteobacteria bacterium]